VTRTERTEFIRVSLETLREIETAVARDTPKLEAAAFERRITNLVRIYCATLSAYDTELEIYSE
jgi:hypothetical protein